MSFHWHLLRQISLRIKKLMVKCIQFRTTGIEVSCDACSETDYNLAWNNVLFNVWYACKKTLIPSRFYSKGTFSLKWTILQVNRKNPRVINRHTLFISYATLQWVLNALNLQELTSITIAEGTIKITATLLTHFLFANHSWKRSLNLRYSLKLKFLGGLLSFIQSRSTWRRRIRHKKGLVHLVHHKFDLHASRLTLRDTYL